MVPSEDAHSSEYLSDCDKRREFISGFSGSAGQPRFREGSQSRSDTDFAPRPLHIAVVFFLSPGTAVITRDSANLFTDGRYFLQASKQLDSNWTLQKFGQPGQSFLWYR